MIYVREEISKEQVDPAKFHEVERLSIKASFEDTTLMVLIGGPGSGKSTALTKLAEEEPKCLRINLREIRAANPVSPAKRLREVLQKQGEGKQLILIDGLDEINGRENRDEILSTISFFTRELPARFILTSRPNGYDDQLGGFTTFYLQPFSNEQIKDYSAQFISDAERLAPLREQFTNEFTRQLAKNPLAMKLARIPCTTRYCCLNFRQFRDVSDKLTNIFKHWTPGWLTQYEDLLVKKFETNNTFPDPAKFLAAFKGTTFERELRAMAFEVMTRRGVADSQDPFVLTKEDMAKAFARDTASSAVKNNIPYLVATFCEYVESNPVMITPISQADGKFEFAHNLVMEVLAAGHVAGMIADIPFADDNEELAAMLGKPEWQEVFKYALEHLAINGINAGSWHGELCDIVSEKIPKTSAARVQAEKTLKACSEHLIAVDLGYGLEPNSLSL